jgi:hypothetical protein
MSTGGLFKLITNDGKQDAMLMATELLTSRLSKIKSERALAFGQANDTPTLLDIERTHVLFTNAHFKPYVAIGYEYNVVAISTGSLSWGAEVSFNIPQFGDFFTDMVVNVRLNQPTLTDVTTTESDQPLVRWCSWPGERVFDKVKFEVNGNVLDDYTSNDVNYFREFCIAPNKLVGWKRLTGQEEEEVGYVDQPNWENSGVAASSVVSRQQVRHVSGLQTPTGSKSGQVNLWVPLLFWFNQDVRLAIPSVAIPQGSRYVRVTLTNKDNMTGLVPRGTGTWANPNARLVNENMVDSLALYVNNIFVNPDIHNIFIKRIGFSLVRVHKRQDLSVNTNSVSLQCQQLKWPIEYIFAGMKMKAYGSWQNVTSAEHLDKWHTFNLVVPKVRRSVGWESSKYVKVTNLASALVGGNLFGAGSDLATNSNYLRLEQTAAAASTISASVCSGDKLTLPASSLTTVTGGVAAPLTLTVLSVSEGTTTAKAVVLFKETVGYLKSVLGSGTSVVVYAPATVAVNRALPESVSSTVKTVKPTIDTVNIKAHGIDLYQTFPADFYASYLTFVFGGPNVNVPEDKGCLFVNFCLYPGTYQPSGHVNVSRAREFYFNLTSSVAGGSPDSPDVVNQPSLSTPANECYLYLLATAINFLLISDGGAVLRYST